MHSRSSSSVFFRWSPRLVTSYTEAGNFRGIGLAIAGNFAVSRHCARAGREPIHPGTPYTLAVTRAVGSNFRGLALHRAGCVSLGVGRRRSIIDAPTGALRSDMLCNMGQASYRRWIGSRPRAFSPVHSTIPSCAPSRGKRESDSTTRQEWLVAQQRRPTHSHE